MTSARADRNLTTKSGYTNGIRLRRTFTSELHNIDGMMIDAICARSISWPGFCDSAEMPDKPSVWKTASIWGRPSGRRRHLPRCKQAVTRRPCETGFSQFASGRGAQRRDRLPRHLKCQGVLKIHGVTQHICILERGRFTGETAFTNLQRGVTSATPRYNWHASSKSGLLVQDRVTDLVSFSPCEIWRRILE